MKEHLEGEYGYVPIDASENNTEKVEEIEVCGYPGNKGNTMWSATGPFNTTDNFLQYAITTDIGQSGGPILKLNR